MRYSWEQAIFQTVQLSFAWSHATRSGFSHCFYSNSAKFVNNACFDANPHQFHRVRAEFEHTSAKISGEPKHVDAQFNPFQPYFPFHA